jgi:hypothetical protein
MLCYWNFRNFSENWDFRIFEEFLRILAEFLGFLGILVENADFFYGVVGKIYRILNVFWIFLRK